MTGKQHARNAIQIDRTARRFSYIESLLFFSPQETYGGGTTVATDLVMSIVCGTDLCGASAPAEQVSASLAAHLDERLVLIHAIDSPTGEFDSHHAPNERLAGEATAKAQAAGTAAVPVDRRGVPDQVLLMEAAHVGASLIVVGTHGRRPPLPWLLGSTAERLTALSPVPVILARNPLGFREWSKDRPLNILVGVDLSGVSMGAVRLALRISGAGPCKVHFALVGSLPTRGPWGEEEVLTPSAKAALEASAREGLARWVARVAESTPPDERLHVLWSDPAEALSRLAAELETDLLLVGTHGRKVAQRALLGSVAQGALRGAPCSVGVVPP